MKPTNILLTIFVGLASLGLVVWIGQYKGSMNLSPKKPGDTIDDVMPMPKSTGPAGAVEIEETEFDFGAKLAGSSDEHTFTFKNTGLGPLQLKLGKPSCQCTVGEIAKSNGEIVKTGEPVDLAPNESVNILVKWNMKAEIQKFRQTVPVYTTDPERRQVDLAITGSVDSPVEMTPIGYWDLGEISKTEPSKASGLIFSKVLDQFTVAEVPRQKGLAKVNFEPADQDTLDAKNAKSGFKVLVEVGPDVPLGLYIESIKVKADIGKPAAENPVTDKPAESQGDADKPVADKPAEAQADADKPAEGQADAEKAASDTAPSATETMKKFTVTGRRSGPIELRGAVGAGLNPATNRLIFSDFPAKDGRKATVTLFVKGLDEELAIKSFEPADTRFKARIVGPGKVFGNSKSYQIEVEIPPGPVGKHREMNGETIDLILNHPEAPDLKLILDYNALR